MSNANSFRETVNKVNFYITGLCQKCQDLESEYKVEENIDEMLY